MKSVILLSLISVALTTDINNTIIGGTLATEGQFPYVVALEYNDDSGWRQTYCSGAIISDRLILTAATCSYICNESLSKCRIIAGRLIFGQDGIAVNITQAIWSETYVVGSFDNNLGIFRVDKIPLSDNIKVIGLPKQDLKIREEVIIMGWGGFVVTNKTLIYEEVYAVSCEIPGSDIQYVCPDSNTIYPCMDTGAPMVYKSQNELIGIGSSWTIRCQTNYSQYILIYPYLEWIEENSKENNTGKGHGLPAHDTSMVLTIIASEIFVAFIINSIFN